MELKVKADDGQQIWLSKEDIYHGSLILVNAAHAYLENTGNKQYLDEILQPVLKQREKDISTKDTTRIETALPEIAERSQSRHFIKRTDGKNAWLGAYRSGERMETA